MYGQLHNPTIATEMGIVSTAVDYLLSRAGKLLASFIEFHDEKWNDLSKGEKIEGKIPKNYHETTIDSIECIQRFLADVLLKRRTKATNQNTHSSRSNAILILSNGNSKLLFVDLVGNEIIDGKENIRESCSINTSLTQLNTVLACKAKHIKPPYRDNDFTFFLKPYLSQNKAVVFFHVRKENIVKDLLKIQDIVGIKRAKKKDSSKPNIRI